MIKTNNSLDLTKKKLREIYLLFPVKIIYFDFFVLRTGNNDGKVKYIFLLKFEPTTSQLWSFSLQVSGYSHISTDCDPVR